tara:strand:- start:172 stop:483 length:312 start_codon:yes stop_codon:yes gene_type:complete
MRLTSVQRSDMPLKKYKAVFCDCATTTTCKNRYRKAVHFGSKGSTTYIDGADDEARANYIKRHRVNEDWTDGQSPGALSRYLLWGDSKDLDKNIIDFKKRFKC